MRLALLAVAALAVGAASAAAQQAPLTPPPAETVQTLIAKGYAVVSAFASQIGPGIFLQKYESLYLCFASETPTSADVKTQYCKPVH